MPITRAIDAVYTLLNATVMENGSLSCTFTVVLADITSFTLNLVVPESDTAAILNATITDNSSIRDTLTSKIYDYFIASGEIVGTVTP